MVYLKLLEIEEENRRLREQKAPEIVPSKGYPRNKEVLVGLEAILRESAATASIPTSTATTASHTPAPAPAAITAATTIPAPIPTPTPATSVSAPLHLPSNSTIPSPANRRPCGQHLKAYTLWYEHKMPLADMRVALRSKESPLTMGTVMYVPYSFMCV